MTLNFVNADIEGVTRAVGAIIGQQFVVDPRVKGSMTLYSDQPMTPREVYQNFLAGLRGLGFTVVQAGGLYKVVPEADAKLQTDAVSVGQPTRRGDQIVTQIFRLTHENANNLVAVLRPLISPNNTINASPGNNTLVITDYADNLQRIAKIIAAMDTPAAADVEVIPLQHAVASDMAALVQRLSEGGGVGAVPGAVPGAAGTSVLVDSRSNSLIVRAANPARVASIRALVAKLDRPTPGGTAAGNNYVIHLKNADAVKLATVLRAAFSASAQGSATGGCDDALPDFAQHAAGHPRQRLSRPVDRHRRRLGGGDGAARAVGLAVDRRLRAGRPGDQLARHQRARAALPPGTRHDRHARLAPRAGLHREHDRRGVGRERRRRRLPVAGPDRQAGRQHRHRARHQLVGGRAEHHRAHAVGARRRRRRHRPPAPPA